MPLSTPPKKVLSVAVTVNFTDETAVTIKTTLAKLITSSAERQRLLSEVERYAKSRINQKIRAAFVGELTEAGV